MSSELVAAVVQSGRATLEQLRTVYDYEDLYRLWEIDYIPIYNRWYEEERSKEKARLNQLAKNLRL